MARSIVIPARRPRRFDAVTFVTAYEDQSEESTEIVFPEDPSTLSDEDLATLQSRAVEAFDAVYGDGSGDLSEDDLTVLRGLSEGLSSLRGEIDNRAAAAGERAAEAASLAAGVRPEGEFSEGEEGAEDGGDEDGDDGDADGEGDEDGGDEGDGEGDADGGEGLTAGAPRREVRVNLSGLSNRRAAATAVIDRPTGAPQTMRDVVAAAADVQGYDNGMDFLDMGRVIDRRLGSYNHKAYVAAAAKGQHLRQQFGLAVISKPFDEGLVLRTKDDQEQIERVMNYAVDQSRLKGNSLLASGGWCAPSETLYDLYEIETRDGLYSLPEIAITRGGIKWTQGPDFSTLFSEITGFDYSEAQDIEGDYGVDANGVGNGTEGSKPCYKVDCPEFDEERLRLDGLCITAGLLQSRGYPEMIARTIRGALVAHDHRMAGRLIAAVAAGSTPVNMPAGQIGATAPILTAIELQVNHYREVHRLSRSAVLEAVFPFWVHGAIRADLSRRLGVDLLSVPDSRITAWFTERGVAPQFVYNWQGLANGAASGSAGAGSRTSYPATVEFLLYLAGTWVKGGADVITLDTVYDSTLLGQNDFTALFTEEGWLVAKRGHDSRRVVVPICADGATAAGVGIACDGSAAA